MQIPAYDDISPVQGAPKGCSWGLFDKDGQKDQVGTLNFLTHQRVREAAGEVNIGDSVVLNWSLNKPSNPFCREKFQHRIKDLGKELGVPMAAYDDVILLNTQSSSQWDGFRHWGHFGSGQYYNGVKHEDIANPDNTTCGIHHWSTRGGIVGRGVLLDYASWADKNDIEIKPATKQIIPLNVLQEILREENVTLKPGDILLVRCGLIRQYESLKSENERQLLMHATTTIGVEASENMARWLWNNQIAAVAGDAVAFESQPFAADFALHDYLLVWLGMPIGELWDLEGLAQKCKMYNRWTFFLTSAPLNVPGGIASPPNALAVF